MADQQPDAADDVRSFVRQYGSDDADRIRFAWNGKHATEFVDANQDFRFRAVEYVCAHPGDASPRLLVDLFTESANWAREAWGSPRHFAELGAALLARGGDEVLPQFLSAFLQSFDTFGACHQMRLDPVITRRLLRVVDERAVTAPTADRRLWDAGRELFSKLAAGTGPQGWVALPPGTPVSDVRVVPRWQLRVDEFWQRIRKVIFDRR